MNIIRAVIVCSSLLIIAPYLIGNLLCRESHVYQFLVGFFSEVGVFGMLAVPYIFLYRQSSFRMLCYIFASIAGALSGVGLLFALKRKEMKQEKPDKVKPTRTECLYIAVFSILVAFQLFRIVGTTEFEYSDEMAYVPIINDTVYMDRYYPKNELTGQAVSPFSPKRILAPWPGFLACISSLGEIHALVICKLIIPAYMLVLFYLCSYAFGRWLFSGHRKNTIVFLTSISFIVEAFWLSNSAFYYIAYPVMWGKMALGYLVMPMVLVYIQKKKTDSISIGSCASFLFIGAGAATMSLMATAYLSMELFFCIATAFLGGKSYRARVLLYSVICALPLLVQGTLLICMKEGFI